jgi:hypothetical protein
LPNSPPPPLGLRVPIPFKEPFHQKPHGSGVASLRPHLVRSDRTGTRPVPDDLAQPGMKSSLPNNRCSVGLGRNQTWAGSASPSTSMTRNKTTAYHSRNQSRPGLSASPGSTRSWPGRKLGLAMKLGCQTGLNVVILRCDPVTLIPNLHLTIFT